MLRPCPEDESQVTEHFLQTTVVTDNSDNAADDGIEDPSDHDKMAGITMNFTIPQDWHESIVFQNNGVPSISLK